LLEFIWRIQAFVNTMPRRKDISKDLGEATVAFHQSGKGYKVFPQTRWSLSFYREKDSSQVEKQTVVNLLSVDGCSGFLPLSRLIGDSKLRGVLFV